MPYFQIWSAKLLHQLLEMHQRELSERTEGVQRTGLQSKIACLHEHFSHALLH